MNITAEIITPILREYDISGQIVSVEPIMNLSTETSTRIVLKIEVKHRSPLIMKLVRDTSKPHIGTERRCVFAEHLRRNGIPTPEHYSKKGQYCLERNIEGLRFDVTLEDFAEGEMKVLSLDVAFELGKLMARIHRISFRDNFKIGVPTAYNAIGRNSVSGIEKLRQLAEKAEISQFKSVTYPHRYCTKPELCREIIAIYDHKIASVSELWGRLPCSAVQGNLLLGSVYTFGDRLGVFDYSRSGDETLIGDMILEGMVIAYDTPTEKLDGLTDADRPTLFRSFFEGYSSICPLTPDERLAACDIYPAFNALWHSRIANVGEDSDSLETIMTTAGRCTDADERLSEIYRLINEDARMIFANELF